MWIYRTLSCFHALYNLYWACWKLYAQLDKTIIFCPAVLNSSLQFYSILISIKRNYILEFVYPTYTQINKVSIGSEIILYNWGAIFAWKLLLKSWNRSHMWHLSSNYYNIIFKVYSVLNFVRGKWVATSAWN